MRWVGRLVLIVAMLVAAVLLWLGTTGPEPQREVRVAGLAGPIAIERDRFGIATITAANPRDAFFAVGFQHAEERLFQMELTRRLGAGRLAEWFGAAALPTDRFMRLLGIYRAAEAEYRALSPDTRAELDAYVAGVNAWLAQRRVALPPEYYLIRARPEPWKPADSLVWSKLMDLELGSNFRNELLRARIERQIGPGKLGVLFPPDPKDAPAVTGTSAALKGLDLDAIYAALPKFTGPTYESNNWVVDGRHTGSGKPMLANDPHLDLTAPGVWYLLHIKTPQLDISGVTAPATPWVVLGHNAHAAWGFTTTTGDVEDLFIEKVDPKDGGRYLTPTGSSAFATRDETIAVRGGDPVTLRVRETRHGPVISDLGGRYGAAAGTGTVLALQATWLMPDDRSPEALRGINYARNWTEFRDAVRLFVAPQQNMVFADDAGEIGFIAPARIPIRAQGDGYMPAPGWTGAYEWKGFIPFEALPQGLNPASGRFVTANARIVADDYKYFISRDWDIPNRARRINQLLDDAGDRKLHPEDFAAIQADTLSLMAQDLVPLMTAIRPRDGRDASAVQLLKSWNFRMERQRVEPLIFNAWLRELVRELLAAKLGPVFPDYWAPRHPVVRGILTEHRDWCRPEGGAAGDCGAVLAASLHRALQDLAQRYGDDMAGWTWGRAHVAPFANQFWSNIPGLRDWFTLDLPTDGGSDTVNRGEMEFAADAPFANRHGAGLRMIVDLAAPAAARFLITPGQSSNPLSPHYRDLARRWRDFAWLTLGGSRIVAVTHLLPATANRGN